MIDWRSTLAAVKFDSKYPVVKLSRISGIEGYRPIDRAEFVEKMFTNRLKPQIKNADYLE